MPNDEVAQGSEDTKADVAAAFDKLTAEPAPVAPVAEAAPEVKAEPSGERARDEQGRFTKSESKPVDVDTPSAPPVKPAPAIEPAGSPSGALAVGGPPAPAAEPVPVLKAPQSWTPAEREEFAKAPPAVQKAALRREAEIAKALNETAEPRKLKEAVAPYEHLFRQAGLTAPQAISNVLQSYAALSTAPPQVRSDIIAELVTKYLGTDESAISLLAGAIDKRGRGGGPTGAPAQTGIDLGQVQAMIRQHVEQERQDVQRKQDEAAIAEFEASQPEYLNDVQKELIAVASMYRREGKPLTVDLLKQAYDKACKINDDVAKAVAQREASKAAANVNASTQKAKAVSSSVKSQPGGPAAPPALGDDTRSHVAAAWEKLAAAQ